jgi:signal transduction histidine kinase/ActR/RegA family two-component response regulator
MPEDQAAGIPAHNLAQARAKGHIEMTGWRARKDGSSFFAEASLWALFAADGSLQGYAKITHDLTARRAADEAERKLEVERAGREAAEAGRDRLATLHRAAQALSRSTTPHEVVRAVLDEVLAEVDATGGIVYTLDAETDTLRLIGQHGHPTGFLDPYSSLPLATRLPPGDALRARTPLFFRDAEELVAAYPEQQSEIRTGDFQASVTLPLVTSNRPVGVLAVRYTNRHEFLDDERSLLLTLSELCAQALERARLYADAEAANRAKDEFLAMLGHELRNPLAPIATAVELMKLRGDQTMTREREVIDRQLGHITRLVDDLLDVSRITRGKLELSRRDVDIADVVARAVEMASPLFEQRHHKLALTAPRGLFVNSDPNRLAQVIGNLLTNAAKYTPRGGRISVEATGSDSEVEITVADNGEGIPPELLPRIFELFVQGARTFDRSGGGLGIGLALVRNLVALHGGSVSAHSTGVAGEGSRFTIRLPRVAGRSEPAREISGVRVASARKRVLLVDDNRDFAEMLAGTLTELGYDVVFELDGVSALERLREFPAEAAVLDLGLPVIDGFELARQIREQFGDRAPRLIAITGYGQPHDRERSADVGFAAHLIKPVDIKAVLAAIERASVE